MRLLGRDSSRRSTRGVLIEELASIIIVGIQLLDLKFHRRRVNTCTHCRREVYDCADGDDIVFPSQFFVRSDVFVTLDFV